MQAAARADDWNCLAAQVPIPSIFLTWEWTETWWGHFGAPYTSCLLFVERGEDLLAVLPLARRRVGPRRDGLFGRVLFLCGSEEVCPDHLDLLAAPGVAPECLAAIIHYLRTTERAWDVVDLSGVAAGGNLDQHRGLIKATFFVRSSILAFAPYVTIDGTSAGHPQRSNAKKRSNLNRRVRLLEQEGARYIVVSAPVAGRFMNEFFALHARRAAAKKIRSTFAGDRLLAFHQEVLERTGTRGWHWNRQLRANDRMVAAIYGYLFSGRMSYYQIAIDPDWDRWSPGTLLIHLSLADAQGSGVREYDFLRGEEEYKERWATGKRPVLRLRFFNDTPTGRLARVFGAVHGALQRIRNWGRQRATAPEVAPPDPGQE